MQRHALVDGNNISKAAFSTQGHLMTSKGLRTGATLTTIDMLRTMLRDKNFGKDIVQVIFAWDSHPSWRSSVYPEYKANRQHKPHPNDYPTQKELLQNTLPFFGIPQVASNSMEADDIAAQWSKSADKFNIVFVSNDRDWLQLSRHPATIVYQTNKKEWITNDRISDHLDGARSVDEYVYMKCIVGDPGDNIPGVPGVGPVKALRYLRGELKSGIDFKKIQDWIDDHETGFRRTAHLYQLGNTPFRREAIDVTPIQYNENEIRRILTDFEAWRRLDYFDDYVAPFRRLHQWMQENQVVQSPRDDGEESSAPRPPTGDGELAADQGLDQ